MFGIHAVETNIDMMVQNAAQVAYHSFEWHYTTLILFNASCIGLHTFVKSYNKNIKLYNIKDSVLDIKSVEDVNQFILFIKHTRGILNAIDIRKLNANGRFIIICNDIDCDENEAVEILWRYRIVNVIFIKKENSVIKAYTYFPSARCDVPTSLRLHDWDKCFYSTTKVIKSCRDYIFPLKFKNFHLCPLIVSTYVQSPYMYIKDGVPYGADGDLLRCIVRSLNATLVLISPRDERSGSVHNNNKWSGTLGNVYHGMANISMTSSIITYERYQNFDISMNYNTMDLVWVTHPSEYEYSTFKLLKPFTRKARVLFLITLIILVIIHIVLKMRIMKKYSDSFFIHAVQICMGFSVTKYPKNLCKHVFLFWVWYWFLVRTLYLVYVIHSLQTDTRVNNIITLSDAIDNGYQFGGSPAARDYFVDDKFIYDNWVIVGNNEMDTMINLAKGRKFLLAVNLVHVKMFKKSTRLSLHILPHKILKSHTVLFFKKQSCLTRDVNHVLTRLFEAGIPNKLFELYTYTPKHISNPHELLTFKHFEACFAILIFGCVLSTFVFILEKLFGKYWK